MYQPEKKCEEINDRVFCFKTKIFYKTIARCRNKNCERYKKFCKGSGKINDLQRTQDKGYRMPDGESSDQHQDLFPVLKCVTYTKHSNKKNMINSCEVRNVRDTHGEVYAEIIQ